MTPRRPTIALGMIIICGLALAACGSGSKGSAATSSTSTTSSIVTDVLPPVIVTPAMSVESGAEPVPPIRVGNTVVFAMGTIPEGGNIIAISQDPRTFLITSKGMNNGTVVINAGGRALATGSVEVELRSSGAAGDAVLGRFRLDIGQ